LRKIRKALMQPGISKVFSELYKTYPFKDEKYRHCSSYGRRDGTSNMTTLSGFEMILCRMSYRISGWQYGYLLNHGRIYGLMKVASYSEYLAISS
jgi:hypothetical protein